VFNVRKITTNCQLWVYGSSVFREIKQQTVQSLQNLQRAWSWQVSIKVVILSSHILHD